LNIYETIIVFYTMVPDIKGIKLPIMEARFSNVRTRRNHENKEGSSKTLLMAGSPQRRDRSCEALSLLVG